MLLLHRFRYHRFLRLLNSCSMIQYLRNYNLWRLVTEGVRYEENTYGYFNSAFVSIFPPRRRFQVSDQLVISSTIDRPMSTLLVPPVLLVKERMAEIYL